MSKIYRTSDKLPVKIQDITFKISPLTFQHRSEIQSHLSKAQDDFNEASIGSFKAIKYAVKEIDGVENYDGSDYKLEFEDNVLTDDCVNDLLNLEVFLDLANSLIHGVPEHILGPDGKPVKGISLLYKDGQKRPNSRKPKK